MAFLMPEAVHKVGAAPTSGPIWLTRKPMRAGR